MRSVGPVGLVKSGTEGRALRITISVVELKVGEPGWNLVPFEQFVGGSDPPRPGSMAES